MRNNLKMASERALTRRWLIICIALLPIICYSDAESSECKSGSLRLPKHVKPIHYDLEVNLNLGKSHFEGRVAIDVKFDEKAAMGDVNCMSDSSPTSSCYTRRIILHAGKELEIERVEFLLTRTQNLHMPMPGGPSVMVDFCRDSSNDQLIVDLDHDFNSFGQLVIMYRGQISRESSGGFYLSEKLNERGEYSPLWVTLSETGLARSVLPCFDEPDLKATFTVTVEHPKGLKALSNMPMAKEREFNERVAVRFEKTPIMSSYLLAMAVGDLDYIESRPSNSEITFRAWAPPGRAEEARESLNVIVEGYEIFAKYFNVKQPLKKIDFLSVDKSGCSSENWGLVTTMPSVLLDGVERRQISYLPTRHYFKTSILGALAHFWLGNLVTVKWWDDSRLYEGFVTLMASAVTNFMFPELGGRHYGLIHEQSDTLNKLTLSRFNHPIKQLQSEIMQDTEGTSDVVAFHKASVVLRMLSNHLGGDKFQIGVQNFIEKFMYKNADANDLWQSLTEISDGLDVAALMNSWIYREGFPLIETSLNHSDNSLRLSQRKFPTLKKSPANEQDTLWVIPISLLISNDQGDLTTLSILMDRKEAKLKLPSWFRAGQLGHYVKVNLEFSGLFRVMYDEDMLKALHRPIADKVLSPADRMNLLDDYQALEKSGLITRAQLENLMSWYTGEQHQVVLAPLVSISHADGIGHENSNAFAIIKNYFHNNLEWTLIEDIDYKLRIQGNLLRTMVRVRVISALVRSRYEPAIDFSLRYFRSRQGKVPIFIMQPIYFAVILAGTDQEYKQVKRLMMELTNQEKVHFIRSIFSAPGPHSERLMNFLGEFSWVNLI